MGRPREYSFEVGQRFGAVEIIGAQPHTLVEQEKFLLRCACGREWWKFRKLLQKKPDALCRSCATAQWRHSEEPTRNSDTYRSWAAMKQRCENPKHAAYARYGGRGITVCKRWQKYENFREDMGARPKGSSLERIDNNRGYSPKNCKWATPQEQNTNARSNRWLEVNGERLHLAAWARRLNTKPTTVWLRLRAGWSAEDACTTPVQARQKRK